MLTGTIDACGTNWAITPATGVPWPSAVVGGAGLVAAVPPAPPPTPPPPVAVVVRPALEVSSLPKPFVKTLFPPATRPRKYGLLPSTPESITATALP